MARSWETIARAEAEEGELELRRRADDDFLITVAGRVLMNSRASRSEEALASLACEAIAGRAAPHVVIGGLGMGLTLRCALDALPADARVSVCELNAPVAEWCRGPLAAVNDNALADPRVSVIIGDVASTIRHLAGASAAERADAIVLDLYEGPHAGSAPRADPFYGSEALARTRRALAPGGAFAVWSEEPDAGFERRLRAAGMEAVSLHRPGRGGRRHAVYVAIAGRAPAS